jgi:nicotinate-nucleotide pyrophosphorylase (carboxylating)
MELNFNTQCTHLITMAIKEDCPNNDITVTTYFNSKNTISAKLISKQNGIFFGKTIIQLILTMYDEHSNVQFYINDGDKVLESDIICTITCDQHTLLLVERTMLNIIQRLCGIATLTNTFIARLNNPKINICDTRKTTPGLRFLEKAAVKMGGGTNHRFNLSDMILIKENHLKVIKEEGSLQDLSTNIVKAKQESPLLKAEIEIETLDQLQTYDLSAFDYVLLDNFDLTTLSKAIKICRNLYPHIEIEVSGNVNLDTIYAYNSFDIDRISIGALTHSVSAFDISLLVD